MPSSLPTKATSIDSNESTALKKRPGKKRQPIRFTSRQWMLLAASAITSLTMVFWAIQVALTNLDETSPIDATNASRRPAYAGGSSPKEIATYREEAHQIDRALLGERQRRLDADANRPRPDGDDVFRRWNNKVQNMESMIRGQKLVPGTVAYDMNERLKELRADPPLDYQQRRELRDH